MSNHGPAQQSQELAARLTGAGVSARLVMVKGGGHGLSEAGEQPSPDELVRMTVDFFARELGPR